MGRGSLLPPLCMFLESLLLPGLVSGGPRDTPDQGPEGMLSKPFPRVTGKFSIQRPVVVVVVSVSVHNQADRTLRSQVILSVSFPSAMLALSLGICLRTLLKGPHSSNISSLAFPGPCLPVPFSCPQPHFLND